MEPRNNSKDPGVYGSPPGYDHENALDVGAKLSGVAKNAWWLVVIPVLAVFFLKVAATPALGN